MSENVATFLAVTGIDDVDVATRFLEITGGDLEYAVTLFMESGHTQNASQPQEVRSLDPLVHRHETLMDSFDNPPMPENVGHRGGYGSARAGIFNQGFGDDSAAFTGDNLGMFSGHGVHHGISGFDHQLYTGRNPYTFTDSPPRSSRPRRIVIPDVEGVEDEEEDEDDVMTVDSVSLDGDDNDVLEDDTRPISTQERLARLFRPPFELITRVSLDQARMLGKQQQRWILVNIQDPSEFQCQVLNRDFWSNSAVKTLVSENFIMIQLAHDSPHGSSYLNYYHAQAFPHLAIIDPITGERVRLWPDGVVPVPADWAQEVSSFLESFSLDPASSNPIVYHEKPIDPDSMTEEQQIEFALKQSLGGAGTPCDPSRNTTANTTNITTSAPPEDKPSASSQTPAPISAFDKIISQNHIEPATNDSVTRVQFRFPNGKRLVHKFSVHESVGTILSWLKYTVAESAEQEYGIAPKSRFHVTNSANRSFRFLDEVEQTVESAGLKNASVLVEPE